MRRELLVVAFVVAALVVAAAALVLAGEFAVEPDDSDPYQPSETELRMERAARCWSGDPDAMTREEGLKEFFESLGVPELNDFEILSHGYSKGGNIDGDLILLEVSYEFTDSSGNRVAAISGAFVDPDTCEATLLKAQ